MTNPILITALALMGLAGAVTVRAELLVYEPFDYAPVNDSILGRVAGKDGGIGWGGPWRDSVAGSNGGVAFVYDSRGNPADLYGGSFGNNQPNWDGVVNNLPTRGGYAGLSDWSSEGSGNDRLNSHRPLALSVGEMAASNGGVLWLSAVWHIPYQNFHAPVGIALTSGGSHFVERARTLSNLSSGAASGNGIGVGHGSTLSGAGRLNPVFWANGSESARTLGPTVSASSDNIIILKFEFGTTDTIRAWYFTENLEMTEAAFNANAISASSSIDEFTLNTLAFSTIRKENAVDEFRIGHTFADVTTVPPEIRQRVEITEITREPETGGISLTWKSNPDENYGIQWSTDLKTFYPAVHQAIPAHASAALTSFGPFPAPLPGADCLFLRIGPPDITPPALFAVGGSDDRIVLTYSEPMLPGTATDPANYLIQKSTGGTVTVLSAAIGDDPHTVVLTLGSTLEQGIGYTVSVANVTDPAGLPIAPGSQAGFTSWNSPFINEFMASNGNNMHLTEVLLDEDGDSSDWIEIVNPTADPLSLDGWFLTDNANNLAKWRIPAVTLAAGEYLIVFASSKDRSDPAGELHTNFNLSAEGEYLALVRPAGQGLASEFSPAFPPQTTGISYGLPPGSTSGFRFFDQPTPWFANAASGYLGLVENVTFSMPRGFYDGPLALHLTCPTPDVTIRYTLDMTEPTLTHGSIADPGVAIPVTTTTCLRARAFKAGWLPSDMETRTYIFPSAVMSQPADPPGFPSTWNSVTAVYTMKPDVVARYTAQELEDSLKSLPSISVVTETPNLFSSATGIYSNWLQKDEAWERPASMEWIDPNGGQEIQLNCGLRLQGGAARLFQKKPFRLLFKGMYGPTKLDFPVFPGSPDAVTSFDTLILRSNSQDRIWGAVMQVTDENGRRTLMDMGTPQSHGTFVHLFVNGLYWGLYNAVERPQATFCADYFGGTKEEWDVNNGNEAIDGTYAPFDNMLAQVRGGPPTNAAFQKIQGRFPDGTRDPASPAYIDMPNYIDYMLANFYLGTGDWAGNAAQGTRNYYCGRHRVEDSPGYHWFVWDAERSLQSGIPTGVIYGPAEPHAWLKNNAEYRLQFADHAQRHLRNGGALTPDLRQPVFTALAARVRAAIILDEARWDQTTVAGFETNIASRTAWFPGRTDAVLTRFRNEGLFPQTEAPVFSQHGGVLSLDNPLTLNTNAAAIYYTLDGSDPRLFGGALSPVALTAILSGGSPKVSEPLFFTGRVTLKTRSFNSVTGEWSALLEAEFAYSDPVPAHIDLVEGADAQIFNPVNWFGAPVANPLFLSATTSQAAVAGAVIDGDGNVVVSGLLRGNSELVVTFNDGINPPSEVRVPVLVYPSAHPLAGGAYDFGEWDPATPAGVFPPHMIFLQGAENDSSLATELDRAYHIPATDAAAASDVDSPYAATSRTRINGLGENGIAFINTGRGRDLGGALLALDTTGLTEARVGFTAGTVLPNIRVYAIRLQYRIGHSGPFTDLTNDQDQVVEYFRNEAADHQEILGPVALPGELLGQPYVQLLWRYHRISGTSGARAQLRLDDLRVADDAVTAPADLGFDSAPAGAQSGALLSPVVVSLPDASGFPVADFNGPVILSLLGEGMLTGTITVNEAARNIAVLYDDAEGTARPLAATPVEITGSQTDARYATFYQNTVATTQVRWGSILPNTLPGGLRRIEIRSDAFDFSRAEGPMTYQHGPTAQVGFPPIFKD